MTRVPADVARRRNVALAKAGFVGPGSGGRYTPEALRYAAAYDQAGRLLDIRKGGASHEARNAVRKELTRRLLEPPPADGWVYVSGVGDRPFDDVVSSTTPVTVLLRGAWNYPVAIQASEIG